MKKGGGGGGKQERHSRYGFSHHYMRAKRMLPIT